MWVKDLRVLPDSTAADYMESVETGKEISRSKSDFSRSMKNAVPLSALIITVLSLILSAILSEHKSTIRFITIYLVAILVLIYMSSNPNTPNPFQNGTFDKHFWNVFLKVYLVAAGVLGCIVYQIARCFDDVRWDQNTFVAILSVAFPAVIIGIAFILLIISMFIMIIPLIFILCMALGSDSGAGTKEEAEKETIYGADGNAVRGSGRILYDSKGNRLEQGATGIWNSSDGKRYRLDSAGNGASQFKEVDY
ncbi:hypothetical protein AGMMS50262_23840 [Bacteroidia bacterium]|nr:hypothetical protein AGMMS50262_23840 [Bacteroidia bacterium]